MNRRLDRREAIKLRLRGKTYTFIKDYLNVSKGTLSYWLKNIKLTKSQIENIKRSSTERRIENYINTRREKRVKIFESYLKNERRNLLPLSKKDYLIAGLFLYLGEGEKSNWWTTSISNTNPSIIKFSVFWLTKVLKVKKSRVRIHLHLYKDMDIEKEMNFWSKLTGISKKQFRKPYIKKTSSKNIDYHTFGHGTCRILVEDTKLKNKVISAIRIMLEESGSYSDKLLNANSPHSVV
ncbi:MAG: hypothetical protein AAB338_02205 [Patescibacteria group bacterium]